MNQPVRTKFVKPQAVWGKSSKGIDLELLTGVMKSVEGYLKDEGGHWFRRKKRLILLRCCHFAKTGEPVNQKTVVSYLKLAL